MPILTNQSNFDIFVPQINKSVGPHGSVEISGAEARLIPDHGVFLIDGDEAAPASRRHVTRGAKTVEVTGKPAMETRG